MNNEKKVADLEMQIDRAREMMEFLLTARRNAYPITLYLEVDGQLSEITLQLTPGSEGDQLTEFLGNWIAGVRFTCTVKRNALLGDRSRPVGTRCKEGGV